MRKKREGWREGGSRTGEGGEERDGGSRTGERWGGAERGRDGGEQNGFKQYRLIQITKYINACKFLLIKDFWFSNQLIYFAYGCIHLYTNRTGHKAKSKVIVPCVYWAQLPKIA